MVHFGSKLEEGETFYLGGGQSFDKGSDKEERGSLVFDQVEEWDQSIGLRIDGLVKNVLPGSTVRKTPPESVLHMHLRIRPSRNYSHIMLASVLSGGNRDDDMQKSNDEIVASRVVQEDSS